MDGWSVWNCFGTNPRRWVGIPLIDVCENYLFTIFFSYRTVYFHPLASVREFSVNSAVWRNKTVATDPHSYHLYKVKSLVKIFKN